MSAFTISEPGGVGNLTMSGSLTIENAGEIKRRLLTAFERSDHLKVRIMEDAEMDVSFLQILCAAHRTAEKSNKIFAVDPTELLIRISEEAGVDRNGAIMEAYEK